MCICGTDIAGYPSFPEFQWRYRRGVRRFQWEILSESAWRWNRRATARGSFPCLPPSAAPLPPKHIRTFIISANTRYQIVIELLGLPRCDVCDVWATHAENKLNRPWLFFIPKVAKLNSSCKEPGMHDLTWDWYATNLCHMWIYKSCQILRELRFWWGVGALQIWIQQVLRGFVFMC